MWKFYGGKLLVIFSMGVAACDFILSKGSTVICCKIMQHHAKSVLHAYICWQKNAIPRDSCWFWTVCGHRDHGRPWAGSRQCLSIKSRGVTPGGTMFLSVLEAVATFGASSLLFSYISFPSIPFLVPGLVLDLVDVFHERLPGSSCAILPALYVSFGHSWRFLLVLDCLWTHRTWKAAGGAPL